MKKPLAVSLLTVGALAVTAALALAYLLLIAVITYAGLLIDIAVTLAAGIGLDALRKLFRKKYEIKAPVFFLCAYLPTLAGSWIYWGVISYLDSIGYFKGWFAGLGEFLFGMSWLITAAAFVVVGGLMLLISFIIEKKRSAKTP